MSKENKTVLENVQEAQVEATAVQILQNTPLLYLASPYTGTPVQQKWREQCAAEAAAWLLSQGVHVISPIVHGHRIDAVAQTEACGIIEPDTWYDLGLNLLNRCDGLVILNIPGVTESMGIHLEVDELEAGKPIYILNQTTQENGGWRLECDVPIERIMEVLGEDAPEYEG